MLSGLAETHAVTPVSGRTHGQHAVPISFGLKVAGWADELARQGERLMQLTPRVLAGNVAGAAGSMSAMGEVGGQVQDRVLEILGLGVPQMSWHSVRDRTAEIVAWTGYSQAPLLVSPTSCTASNVPRSARCSKAATPETSEAAQCPRRRTPPTPNSPSPRRASPRHGPGICRTGVHGPGERARRARMDGGVESRP